MQNEVHIKIGADGIEFDAKGDSDFIERERNAFEAKLLPLGVDAVTRTRGVVQAPQIIAQDEYPVIPEPSSTVSENILPDTIDWSKISLASFAKQKGADSINEFILCAAYFNEKKNGVASFSSTTAKEFYSDAKKPLPSNVSMAINQLASKGLIMENPSAKGANPKEYILTNEGEETIERMQPKEGKEKKVSAKPRKSRPKSESIYTSINANDLNLQNYPTVKSLKDFKEKMMMVLYIITNENKGVWFSVADVLYLMTDVFGEAATKDQVNGVFKREKLWFKSENIEGNNKEKRRKLLNAGSDFAKGLFPTTT